MLRPDPTKPEAAVILEASGVLCTPWLVTEALSLPQGKSGERRGY